jgi:hypothetical protein
VDSRSDKRFGDLAGCLKAQDIGKGLWKFRCTFNSSVCRLYQIELTPNHKQEEE